MIVTNVSEFRKNLKSYIDTVSDNNDTLIVHSNGRSVVLVSLEEYNKYDETEYLLSTDANKKMMYQAKKEIEKGRVISRSIKDIKKMISHD